MGCIVVIDQSEIEITSCIIGVFDRDVVNEVFLSIIIGIVELIQAFQGGGWGIGLLGGLSVIIGIWLLLNAWDVVGILPWVLGIMAIIGGIFAIVMAFKSK